MGKTFKILMLLFFLSIGTGCSSGSDEEIPSSNSVLDDFKISEVVGLDLNSVRQEDVFVAHGGDNSIRKKTVFYGLKNNKLWMRVHDKESKRILAEYCYDNVIPQSIPLPYGESFNVVDWDLQVYECNNLLFVDAEYFKIIRQEGFSWSTTDTYPFSGPVFVNGSFVSLADGCSHWYEDGHILKIDKEYVLIDKYVNIKSIKSCPAQGEVAISYNYAWLHDGWANITIHDLYTGHKFSVELKELMELKSQTNQDHVTVSTPTSVIDDKYVEVVCNVTLVSGEKKVFKIVISIVDESYTWNEVEE